MTPSNSSSPISASCKAIRSCASTRYASIPAYSSAAPQLADYPLAGPRLPAEVRGDLARLLQRDEPLGIQCDDVLMLKGLVGSSELISLAPWDVVAADVEAGRLALLPWPAGAEPARAKGSAYGLVSRAGRSLSPAAAVFVEQVLEQDRRFAAT